MRPASLLSTQAVQRARSKPQRPPASFETAAAPAAGGGVHPALALTRSHAYRIIIGAGLIFAGALRPAGSFTAPAAAMASGSVVFFLPVWFCRRRHQHVMGVAAPLPVEEAPIFAVIRGAARGAVRFGTIRGGLPPASHALWSLWSG